MFRGKRRRERTPDSDARDNAGLGLLWDKQKQNVPYSKGTLSENGNGKER